MHTYINSYLSNTFNVPDVVIGAEDTYGNDTRDEGQD